MTDPSVPLASFDLTGKVAVVTGGCRGLGRAMATAFSACGATVVVASRKAEACERVAAEIAAATGGATLGLGCHVGRWDETEALFDKVVDVNLKGPFRLSALVAERMASGDGRSIINVSSIAAVQPGGAAWAPA